MCHLTQDWFTCCKCKCDLMANLFLHRPRISESIWYKFKFHCIRDTLPLEESQKVPLYVLGVACGFLHFTNFQKPSIPIPKELGLGPVFPWLNWHIERKSIRKQTSPSACLLFQSKPLLGEEKQGFKRETRTVSREQKVSLARASFSPTNCHREAVLSIEYALLKRSS